MEQQGAGCTEQQKEGVPVTQPQPQKVCTNCGSTRTRQKWCKDQVTGSCVCEACYRYQRRHGCASPYRTIQQSGSVSRAAAQPQRQRVCANCAVTETSEWCKDQGTGSYVCIACYSYRRRYGCARPYCINQQVSSISHAAVDAVRPQPPVPTDGAEKRTLEVPAAAGQSVTQQQQRHKRMRQGLSEDAWPAMCAAGGHGTLQQQDAEHAEQLQQHVSPGYQGHVQQQAQQQQPAVAAAATKEVESTQAATASCDQQRGNGTPAVVASTGAVDIGGAAEEDVDVTGAADRSKAADAAAAVPVVDVEPDNTSQAQATVNQPQNNISTAAAVAMAPQRQRPAAAAYGQEPTQGPQLLLQAQSLHCGMHQQDQSIHQAGQISANAAEPASAQATGYWTQLGGLDLSVAAKRPQILQALGCKRARTATAGCSHSLAQEVAGKEQLQASVPAAAAAAAMVPPYSQQLPNSVQSAAAAAVLPLDSQQEITQSRAWWYMFNGAPASEHPAAAAAMLPSICQPLRVSLPSAAGTVASAAAMPPPDTQQHQNDGTGAHAAAGAAGSKQQPDNHKQASPAFTGAGDVSGAAHQNAAAVTAMAMDLSSAQRAQVTVSKPQHVSTLDAIGVSAAQGQAGAAPCERGVPHIPQARAGAASVVTSLLHSAQPSTESDLSAFPSDLLQLLPALPADDGALIGAQFLNQVSCGMFKLLKAVNKAEWQREAVHGLSAAFKTEEGRRSFQSLVYPMLLGAVQAGEKGMVVDVLADWLGKE